MNLIVDLIQKYDALIKSVVTILVFLMGYLLNAKARKIQSLMALNSYREPIRAFSNEVIDILTKIEGLCEVDPMIKGPSFWDAYNQCITEISALRDKGKLVIPNESPGSYGKEKAKAYQGIRSKALDCLKVGFYVAIAINYKTFDYNKAKIPLTKDNRATHPQLKNLYLALSDLPNIPEGDKKEIFLVYGPFIDILSAGKGLGPGWSCKSAIVEAKRQFVSEAQDLIDPRLWIKHIDDIRIKS